MIKLDLVTPLSLWTVHIPCIKEICFIVLHPVLVMAFWIFPVMTLLIDQEVQKAKRGEGGEEGRKEKAFQVNAWDTQ